MKNLGAESTSQQLATMQFTNEEREDLLDTIEGHEYLLAEQAEDMLQLHNEFCSLQACYNNMLKEKENWTEEAIILKNALAKSRNQNNEMKQKIASLETVIESQSHYVQVATTLHHPLEASVSNSNLNVESEANKSLEHEKYDLRQYRRMSHHIRIPENQVQELVSLAMRLFPRVETDEVDEAKRSHSETDLNINVVGDGTRGSGTECGAETRTSIDCDLEVQGKDDMIAELQCRNQMLSEDVDELMEVIERQEKLNMHKQTKLDELTEKIQELTEQLSKVVSLPVNNKDGYLDTHAKVEIPKVQNSKVWSIRRRSVANIIPAALTGAGSDAKETLSLDMNANTESYPNHGSCVTSTTLPLETLNNLSNHVICSNHLTDMGTTAEQAAHIAYVNPNSALDLNEVTVRKRNGTGTVTIRRSRTYSKNFVNPNTSIDIEQCTSICNDGRTMLPATEINHNSKGYSNPCCDLCAVHMEQIEALKQQLICKQHELKKEKCNLLEMQQEYESCLSQLDYYNNLTKSRSNMFKNTFFMFGNTN